MQTHMTSTSPGTESSPTAPAARAVARQNPARRAGFTLIEMLVVVIIIAILAGMVLGLSKISSIWTQKSKTNTTLGKVRSAIEQYNAEYGKYPPVPVYKGIGQPFFYEFPKSNGMNQFAFDWLTVPSGVPASPPGHVWSSPDTAVFTFGLMSFLISRYNERKLDQVMTLWSDLFSLKQWTLYNLGIMENGVLTCKDQPNDTRAIKLWAADISDVCWEGTSGAPQVPKCPERKKILLGYPVRGWTNSVITVLDAWNHELNYQSLEPYQSYRLWSNGPDGVSGTPDDLSTGPGY